MVEENITITFRLRKSVLDSLKKEAESNYETLNSLVTRIFRQHDEWHKIAPKIGQTYFSKSIIQQFLENCDNKTITAIANDYVTKELKGQMWLSGKNFDGRSFLDFMELWIKNSGFQYEHKDEESICTLSIHHNMGEKFSFFLYEIFKVASSELQLNVEKLDKTDKVVTFKTSV